MPGETPIEGVPPQRKAELPLSESGRRVLDSLGLAPMLDACLDPLSPLNKMTHDEILAAAAELSPDLPSFLYISDMDKLPVIPGKDRIFAAKKAAVQAVNATYPVGTDVKVLQNALKAASQTYQGLGLSGERITELGLSQIVHIFPLALVLLQQVQAMRKATDAESISTAPTEPGDDLIKAALFWSAVSAKLMNKVDHDEQNIPALLSEPGSPESGETSEPKKTVMQMAAEMVLNKISEDILLRLDETESVAGDGSQLDGLTAQAEGHATRLFGAEEEQDKLHQRFFNALVAINMFTDGKLGKANKGSTSGGVLSIEIAAPLQGRNGNPSVYVEVARDGIYLYKQSTDGRRSPYYNKYDRQIHGKQYEPLEDFFQRTVAKAREEAMASRLSPDKMESITRLLEQCELAIKAVAETKETSAKQYAKNYDRLRRWQSLLQDRDGNPLFGDIVASDRYGEVLVLHRVHKVAGERVGRRTGNGDIVVAVTGEGMYEIDVTGAENTRAQALAFVRQEIWKPYQGTPEEFNEYLNAALEAAVKKMPTAEHTAALQAVIEGLLPQVQAASERLGPIKKTQAERYQDLLALNKLLVTNGRLLLMYQEQEYENYGRCSVFFNPMGETDKKAIVVSENAVYEVDIPYEEIHITSILASVKEGAENHQWRVYTGTGEELAGFLKQAIEEAIIKMTDSEKAAALPGLANLNIQVSLPPAEAGEPAESGLAEAISATLQGAPKT